ncbi:MAG: hypothetical protein ASARMPRED_003115 [Alectoria sarmentosa]|nr:MAG: hypothetical protein ASARMPRED_003115 [Alectoria sarmentosa]
MVHFWDSIPDDLRDWAFDQQVFFTASAPLTGKHVNISPKGLPSSTFSIFGPNHAAYVDATGSGSESISHVYENGRITIMFCSFAKSPRIMRFFCMGKVVEWDDPRFDVLLKKMGKERIEGARAVILLDIFKVQTSCGFGVPLLTTAPTSEEANPLDAKPVLLDRDTMGHWSHRKVETNTLLDYQAENNASSLDGCPGMRSAMRDRGERLLLANADPVCYNPDQVVPKNPYYVFGNFEARLQTETLTVECNVTEMSSSSALTTPSSSSLVATSTSGVTQSTATKAPFPTAAGPSSNRAQLSKNGAASQTRIGVAVEQSSKPAPASKSSAAIGTGIGVPVGVLLLSGLVLLFLRERRRRVHAQKMANSAYRVARARETNGVRNHELYAPSLPQELEHVQKRPEELSSWEPHEAVGHL